METLIYIISAILTVGWSIWIFLLWEQRAGLKESSPLRFVLLFLQGGYPLLIILSGWAEVIFLRIDLLGLILLSLSMLLIFLLLLVISLLNHKNFKRLYLTILIGSQLLFALLVAATYLLKSYPIIAIRISSQIQAWKEADFLEILWQTLSPGTEPAITMVSKILIALASYLPLTLVRMWYTNKHYKMLRQEIEVMKGSIYKDILPRIPTDGKLFPEAARPESPAVEIAEPQFSPPPPPVNAQKARFRKLRARKKGRN